MTKLSLLLVALAACGTNGTPESDAVAKLQTVEPQIDRVVLDASSSIAQNPPPDVSATATGDAARAIYTLTLDLPTLPPGGYSCPADFGIEYTLTFFAGADQIVAGTVQPGGCEIATLAAQIASASLSVDGGYWSTLAADFGIPESTIYPYVPPT